MWLLPAGGVSVQSGVGEVGGGGGVEGGGVGDGGGGVGGDGGDGWQSLCQMSLKVHVNPALQHVLPAKEPPPHLAHRSFTHGGGGVGGDGGGGGGGGGGPATS